MRWPIYKPHLKRWTGRDRWLKWVLLRLGNALDDTRPSALRNRHCEMDHRLRLVEGENHIRQSEVSVSFERGSGSSPGGSTEFGLTSPINVTC